MYIFIIEPIVYVVNVFSIDGKVLLSSRLWLFANRWESPLLNNIKGWIEKDLDNQNIQKMPLIQTFFWHSVSIVRCNVMKLESGSVAHFSSFPKSVLDGGPNGFENSYFILYNVMFSGRSTFNDSNCWIRRLVIIPISISNSSLFGLGWQHIGEGRFLGGGGIGDNDASRFGGRLGARG